jgi:hypothetical protein
LEFFIYDGLIRGHQILPNLVIGNRPIFLWILDTTVENYTIFDGCQRPSKSTLFQRSIPGPSKINMAAGIEFFSCYADTKACVMHTTFVTAIMRKVSSVNMNMYNQ